MPSGSRGGGGGGHSGGSSGGGRSGGSHFGGGSRSRLVKGVRNGRTVVFIGTGANRRYISNKLFDVVTMLRVLITFAVFFAIPIIMIISSINGQLEKIKEDYSYYQNMIEVADSMENQNVDGYIIYGTITGKDLKYDNKYYLTYSFEAKDGSIVDNGYTFSTYTFEEVKDLIPGVSQIKLALETNQSNEYTDSIDYNYKYTTLEDDGEYTQITKNKQTLETYLIVLISATVVCLIIMAVILIKGLKKEKSETQELNANTSRTIQETPRKEMHCRYCGSIVLDGKTSCDNCGAGIYGDNDFV